jgi:hypothetical protein
VKSVILFIIIIGLFSCKVNDKIVTISFSDKTPNYVYPVEDFKLPKDWSDFEYAEFKLKISSVQKLVVTLYTNERESAITVTPAANVWLTIDIPLKFYKEENTEGSEMADLYSRARTTGWFNIWGVKCGPLNHVDSIGFSLESFVEKTRLDIASVKLTKNPKERFLDPKVLVDKFGQWIPDDWDGKIKNIGELRKVWRSEDSLLSDKKISNRDSFGGFSEMKRAPKGYFYVEKIKGRWWFVDPRGNLFLASGMNGVSAGNYTRTEKREYIFAELPPPEFRWRGNGNGSYVSFSLWNQKRRFGEQWKDEWRKLALKRLKAWGFTAINWSDPSLNKSFVYTKFLEGWGIEEGVMGLPDIYSRVFAAKADSAAKAQCLPLKDDSLLLGYFIGNEPVWPGIEPLVADAILRGPDTEMRKKLLEFLKNGDTPERRKEFIHKSYIRFLKIITDAIRKYDPNHLILGIRYGGDLNIEDKVIEMAGIFDVFSFNAYVKEIPEEKLDRVSEILDKPVLIGEFHFGAAGRGLAGGLQPVASQKDRGRAYRRYVENAMAHPAVVGTFWFQWRDQPNTGRGDGENYNIGFVDVTDLVYGELADAAKLTHGRLYDIHTGIKKPYNFKN